VSSSKLSLSAAGVDSVEHLSPALTALNENHLLAWAEPPPVRRRFADELAWYLRHLPHARLAVVEGARVTSLVDLARELSPALAPEAPIEPRIEGRHGLIDTLRHRPSESGHGPPSEIVKHRFVLWRDAEVMMQADPVGFARAVDALLGVAAETEYTEEDRLLLLRCVFVGDASLLAYSREPESAFMRWWREGREQPLWATITGIDRPRIHRLHVV
jgi:hypothetical protein